MKEDEDRYEQIEDNICCRSVSVICHMKRLQTYQQGA